MPRYFVFLRAINVGKHNRIRMEELRVLCAGIGFEGVSTYIQTGNIVLHSDEEEEAVVSRLEAELEGHGLRGASAIVRTGEEVSEMLDAWLAFGTDENAKPFVTLFRSPIAIDSMPASGLDGIRMLGVRERELLWARNEASPRPADGGLLERKLGVVGTTRYLAVVRDFVEFGLK